MCVHITPVLFFSFDPEKEKQVEKIKRSLSSMQIEFCYTSNLAENLEEIINKTV